MKKVLFITTELQKPLGGLHRYAIELLPAWREAFKKNTTGFEPLVLGLKDPLSPEGDLKPSKEFEGAWEAERGGEKCLFLEPDLNAAQRNDFEKKLWTEYGVNSLKADHSGFYQQLVGFWKKASEFAARLEFDVVDCQDWLSFPAGFLIKKSLDKPLVCRFHSGEFGRSLGNPNKESAQLSIESRALREADFVQSVSVNELRFELKSLMPLAGELGQEKKKSFEEALAGGLPGLEWLGGWCGALPNGIDLTDWRKMTAPEMKLGRQVFESAFPKQKNFLLFVGRPAYLKGIFILLEAMKEVNAGLLVCSGFDREKLDEFMERICSLGLEKKVVVRDGWVQEKLKKALFCSTDAIVLPSLYEPFGIVALEAMAASLACQEEGLRGPVVVVGGSGGMQEIARDGESGAVVPVKRFKMKTSDLAMGVNKALDKKNRKRFSAAAADRVREKTFDWRHVAERMGAVYEKAIENHSTNQT